MCVRACVCVPKWMFVVSFCIKVALILYGKMCFVRKAFRRLLTQMTRLRFFIRKIDFNFENDEGFLLDVILENKQF